jgi:hypothetical protein
MGKFDRVKTSPYSGQFVIASAGEKAALKRLCGSEPSLDELLAEPLVKLAMAADHIDPAVMYALFREVRQKLNVGCRI